MSMTMGAAVLRSLASSEAGDGGGRVTGAGWPPNRLVKIFFLPDRRIAGLGDVSKGM